VSFNALKRYLPLVLVVLVMVLALLGGRLLAMNRGNGGLLGPSVTPQSETPSLPEFYVQPEMARIKLCPFDQNLSVVSSSHRYEYSGPQSIIVYAKRGDRVEITLKVDCSPDLLSCIRDTLKISSKLNVEYGLSLEPSGATMIPTIPGAKRLSTSNIEFSREGGLYKLLITVSVEDPGKYYITLYSWVKITGGVDMEGATEHTIYLVID